MMIGRKILGIDDKRVPFPLPDGFTVESTNRDIWVRMWAAIEINHAHAVHELADHVHRGRQLNHRNRPNPRHDERYTGRPALTDVVVIDLAFFRRLRRRIKMFLSFRRHLGACRRRKAPIIVWSLSMQPHSSEIERRLWSRLRYVRGSQRAER